MLAGIAIVGLALTGFGCGSEDASDDCTAGSGGHLVLEKITEQFLETSCVPRMIPLDDSGTPGDTSDDFAPCTLLEAIHQPAACDCAAAPGRIAVLSACVAGGRQMDDAAKAALARDGHCSTDPSALPRCDAFCVCLVQQYSAPSEKNACLNDVSFVPDGGWCYVDPFPAPAGQSAGNVDLVADCPENEKRKLRYVPAANAVPYFGCSG